ncbi:DUF1638 domain-containing protein [Actibacterium sp. XHP0104]|uniref:DUF1638 domain-containing protein n=1 Tax=Actibacterium sp. XHP0104 TaxID=2984335 RepID=UPI0021E9217F|nr:DUF1638 domain-containing protein [Actibacterium sp. XHP0104]MCV2881056.1 DUF1638 domain-containing protein [Actibacterium sp. XHP0104]
MDLDDTKLTHEGLKLPAPQKARVLLLACGALAHEILALIRANGWDHLSLTCLPAILHNTPEKITPAVEQAVLRHRDDFDQIFVVYADCGTGGLLQAACERLGVEMMPGPHCYAFFEGVDSFAEHGEGTAFYLTDFLVKQFDSFVWKPLGLDRYPELLPSYFRYYDRLVYLAQTDDPDLDSRARDCAARLGLEYERRLTGYGDLGSALTDHSSR